MRDEVKAKKLEQQFGVHGVVGSFKDAALVERLAENAHVVFSLVRPTSPQQTLSHPHLLFVLYQADSDDVSAMQAILKGLRQRHAQLGDLPILIHTVCACCPVAQA